MPISNFSSRHQISAHIAVPGIHAPSGPQISAHIASGEFLARSIQVPPRRKFLDKYSPIGNFWSNVTKKVGLSTSRSASADFSKKLRTLLASAEKAGWADKKTLGKIMNEFMRGWNQRAKTTSDWDDMENFSADFKKVCSDLMIEQALEEDLLKEIFKRIDAKCLEM